MNIRKPQGAFVRVVKDETVFWNPHTGACVIADGIVEFAERLSSEWVSMESIFADMATVFGVTVVEVSSDISPIVEELILQGLLERHSDEAGDKNDEYTPLGDFYKRHNIPVELHVDLTDACTERCVHCYVPQGQHDYLPYDLAEKVLREFRGQQGLTVQLSGGECMKHPDFANICRLCRKLDLNFIVLSNLTLCDEKIIEVLKETDPQFVNVSLYSMVPEEHDAITQIHGSWQKTMAAMDACQQAGIHIRLATPLLKANKNAYPALRKFAEERHVHLIPDCEIIPRCNGDCSNLNYACSPGEVEVVLSDDKVFWDRGYGRGKIPKPDDKVCDIGKLLCLNSKGEYYPCSGMHGYVLGNASRETLMEVWKGEKMNYLRGLKNLDFPKCVCCEHRPFCKVCPAFNYNATGSLFETIPAKCALAEVKHRVFGGN